MNHKHWIIFLSTALLLLATLACSIFSGAGSPLKFAPDTLPDAQLDTPYEAEISISQNRTPVGEFSIAKGALPAGLELARIPGKNSAKISGAPSESGTFTFTVSVWCYGTNVSGQTGEKEYTIIVP